MSKQHLIIRNNAARPTAEHDARAVDGRHPIAVHVAQRPVHDQHVIGRVRFELALEHDWVAAFPHRDAHRLVMGKGAADERAEAPARREDAALTAAADRTVLDGGVALCLDQHPHAVAAQDTTSHQLPHGMIGEPHAVAAIVGKGAVRQGGYPATIHQRSYAAQRSDGKRGGVAGTQAASKHGMARASGRFQSWASPLRLSIS